MTKGVINYKNGKIYKIEPICEHDEGEIYIGSTTKQYLSQRMTAHRGSYTNYKKGVYGKTSCFELFDKYGKENCDIVLLELVEANSKDELHTREAHYIKTIKCINARRPILTTYEAKEYTEKRNETSKVYHAVYRDENKELLIQKRKVRYEQNKEKIKQEMRKRYHEKKQILT
jgi:hypothetical protein